MKGSSLPLSERLASAARTIQASVLARDVGALWVAEGVTLIAGFLQAVTVARVLGPTDFGRASLIVGSVTLIFTILDPRAREAVVRFLTEYRTDEMTDKALALPKVAYSVDLLFALLAFLVVLVLSPWLSSHVLHSNDFEQLLFLFASAFLFSAPSATSKAILTATRRFSVLARLQAASSLARAILTVALVGPLGIHGVIYATAAVHVLESVAAAALARRQMIRDFGASWRLGRFASLGEQRAQIMRFIIYTDITSLAGVLFKEADLVVLGYVRGPTESGYYRLAKLLATPVGSLLQPLQQAVYPRFSELFARSDLGSIRASARRYTLAVGLPVGAGILCIGPVVAFAVPLIAGYAYRPAIGAALILIPAWAFIAPAFWLAPALMAAEHLSFLLRLNLGVALLTVTGYFLLGNEFGGTGVAASRALFAGFVGTGGMVAHFHRADKRGSLLRFSKRGMTKAPPSTGPLNPAG